MAGEGRCAQTLKRRVASFALTTTTHHCAKDESGMNHSLRHSGFTLIELLVVVAIIGVLVTILLPAVQAVREVARRTQCQNHLKQMALGALNHHDQQGHFPTGGWDHHWTGDPDRGYDDRQAGGWAFNLLPFIEQDQLHQLGAGESYDEKVSAIKKRAAALVPVYFCPSRRSPLVLVGTHDRPACSETYNNASQSSWKQRGPVTEFTPLDYVANGGDASSGDWYENAQDIPHFPKTWSQADDRGWVWPRNSSFTGVIYPRSLTRIADVSDGTSKTYLFGDKFEFTNYYESNWAQSPEGLWQQGSARPIHYGEGYLARFRPPIKSMRRDEASGFGLDQYGIANVFGSAHSGGVNVALCDGSVRTISYDIDKTTLVQMAVRNDGRRNAF